MLADQDDDQHKDGEQQVFDRAEILRGVAAAEGVYTDRNQAQTDGKHHRAGNDRGQQLAQRLQKKPSTVSNRPPIKEAPMIAL